jgi:type VI secretion system secreted protein VgrG
MAHTQDNRHIAVTTPLGKDVLLLKGITGHEGLSRLFSFQLDLLSEKDRAIDFTTIVGKQVSVELKHAGGKRFFHGVVNRFSQGAGDATFASYRAEVVPWLWLLTQTADCRIFQNLSVPDILKKVFVDLGFSAFKFNLTKAYAPREYCVQYRETDFNFVSRLMEEEGIFYFFEHTAGAHTLIMGDRPGAHLACAPEKVKFGGTTGGVALPEDVVTSFTKEQRIHPGKYALTDYNFETPSVNLDVTVDSVHPVPGGAKLEIYDYPGPYQKRAEGEAIVRLRIEEEEAARDVFDGAGGCRGFIAGFRFALSGNARGDLDAPYVLTQVQHSAAEYGYDTQGSDEGDFVYANSFTCIPAGVPFRPPRTTPRPSVQGSQTAEVVGPKGEEIYTDKFGRVKVQFHWDREGKKNESSSCWVRASQPWAGQGWGSVSIPRIGQEVVVDFLEGDPDQPIILGRVYNGERMPPYALPKGGMVSGVKSNTTPGGGGSNEISLDDTKGKEKIVIHGQYDMDSKIEHDVTKQVGNDETITITGNRTETVGKDETITIHGARTEDVAKDEAISIAGNRTLTVAKSQSTDVGENRTQSIAKNETLTIGEKRTQQVSKDDSLDVGKNLQITAGDSIIIKTGDASLTMKKDGTITLKGKDITVTGSGKIIVKADGDLILKGSKISQN